MYGLEKEGKFDFDLEIEIKKKPKRKDEIVKEAKEKVTEIKTMLQAKDKSENFEKLGILLNGYDALVKVISKI
jgi:hypothetical protein